MRRLQRIIAFVALSTLFACTTAPPRWRSEAIVSMERARKGGADSLFPAEFSSAAQAFRIGEELLRAKETGEAEKYYNLALLKSELLEQKSKTEKARRAEEARRVEERKQAEEEARAQEKAKREAAEEEARLKKEEAEDAANSKKPKPQKERPLVFAYTVRRGESLPLIASRPEVYGDRNLWPLIYRANRDQIRDPRHIWPGQVFRIPRNAGKEEIAEARRFAQEHPLR